VHADSFIPVRQFLTDSEKIPAKRRVKAKVAAVAGRFDLNRKVRDFTVDEAIEREFDRAVILCKETVKHIGWQDAYAALKTWEYTGRARRGYFIKGLSGAQFVRASDYTDIIYALEAPVGGVIWLNAVDPCQVWGQILKNEKRLFNRTKETAVALKNGEVAAVFTKSGGALNVFDYGALGEILDEFKAAFDAKQIYAHLGKVTVSEYSADIESCLAEAGFVKQMADYVYWRKIV
jgi:ATP-dependent Lhr-like helicase